MTTSGGCEECIAASLRVALVVDAKYRPEEAPMSPDADQIRERVEAG